MFIAKGWLVIFGVFLILCLMVLVSVSWGNEALRVAGMGGVFIGIKSPDAGVFGNPAALIDVEANNLTVAFSIEDARYEEVPKTENEYFASMLSLRSKPSIYYSRAFRDMGFSIGYLADVDNDAEVTAENTVAIYDVHTREFTADTNLFIRYDTLWKRGLALGFSKKLQDAYLGIRLKMLRQSVKRGRIVSTVQLKSVNCVHTNPNDPRDLLPCVVDDVLNQFLDDPKESISRTDEVEQDLSSVGFDIDVGMQTDVLTKKFGVKGLTAGFTLKNLLHRKIAVARHAEVGIGLGYTPVKWATVGMDVRKNTGEKGMNIIMGGEILGQWRRGFSADVALRSGLDLSSARKRFAFGALLALGNSYWEYALIKEFNSELFRNASHIAASTIRF